MIKVLRSKKAEGYIDVAVSLIVILMVVVIALNVFSFLTLKMDMDYFAREMVDVATANGTTSCTDISDRYRQLAHEVGFSPSCSWDAVYISGTKVQYGEPIAVTITYQSELAGLGAANIPITLTAKYSGLSQRYWK